MYSRKNVGPRMDQSGTPALTGYSCEDFPYRTTWSCLLLWKEEIKPTIRQERLMFVKKTSIPNFVESLENIKCYSSSSSRPVKTPSNSISRNCQKIFSRSRRPKTILEIRKKATFLWVINNPFIYKFFKDVTNHRKETNSVIVYSSSKSEKQDSFRHILKSSASMFVL